MNETGQPMNIKLVVAGIAGFLGVALAAFGAHSLPADMPILRRSAYETAGQFQLIHALLLTVLALAPTTKRLLASYLFTFAGMVLFCGALYVYALTGARGVTIAAPVGGASFMIGWLLLASAGAPPSIFRTRN